MHDHSDNTIIVKIKQYAHTNICMCNVYSNWYVKQRYSEYTHTLTGLHAYIILYQYLIDDLHVRLSMVEYWVDMANTHICFVLYSNINDS